MPGHEEVGEDVGSEDPLEAVLVNLLDGGGHVLLGRVVDQDVDAAEVIDDFVHHPLAVLVEAHVCGEGNRFFSIGCFQF